MKAPSTARRRQHGAALLIMMLVVLVAATAVLVTKLNSNDARARSLTEAQDVLARARQALLDYAAVHPDFIPGETARLPCPDIDASGGLLEGESHTASCGAAGETVMGRLPWRTLGVTPFRDSGEACLWYVVSGSYKEAGAASSPMINADTNGQLQLYGIEAGTVITGLLPAERPVAMIIAPMTGVGGQSRAAPSGSGARCSASFNAGDFLEADALSGISNATLSGTADAIDQFAVATGYNGAHNDRIATISRADLARVVTDRHDFDSNMRALGLAVAACVADYARNNPGGGSDYRLPWPAPLGLANYRLDAAYDDANAGLLSGRLPDFVDDSNAATGNPVSQILAACDSVAVPAWTPQMLASWRHWKDHFFYAVAESYAPVAPVPSSCTTCLTVNGGGQYSALVLFANHRLATLGQVRDGPPIDADTKGVPDNYLEGGNEGLMPYASGSVDFTSQTPTATFNDRVFCIDAALNVSEC